MAIYDQVIRAKRRQRAVELLQKGLTTRQIAERTGMTTRAILRLKKKLEDTRVRAQAEHSQGSTT
jgi:transposase